MAKLMKMQFLLIALVVLAVLAMYYTKNVCEGFVSFDDFLQSIGVIGIAVIVTAVVMTVIYFIFLRPPAPSS